VRKLTSKEREGAKVRKRYDVAQTPYQRLVASGVLDGPTRERLAKLYQVLDPVHLRRSIDQARAALHAERELPKTSRAAQLQAGRGGAPDDDDELGMLAGEAKIV